MPIKKNSKMTDRYFDMLDNYQKKFGPKTIVIWQCGSFYELYDNQIQFQS